MWKKCFIFLLGLFSALLPGLSSDLYCQEYTITEEELTQLMTELQTQETLVTSLQTQTQKLKELLTESETQRQNLQAALNETKKSYDESKKENRTRSVIWGLGAFALGISGGILISNLSK